MGGSSISSSSRLEAAGRSQDHAGAADEGALKWLADKGYDPAYGARPLKRVIQKPMCRMVTARSLPNDPDLRRAGVAVLVSGEASAAPADLVVTLRASRLNRHSGQFALPGGRLDAGETAIQAALRETHEEIGLSLGEDAVLGLLDDMITRSGFAITPVVVWAGVVSGYVPDPGEVAEVYRIPLSELDGPDVPAIVPDHDSGKPVMSAVFPTVGHRMFAPTAAMIYQFREVCLHGRATRVADMGQPEFTRG
jgi:8-oxo-dGTP pyrophosphatase MutT (NUDIX family)